VGMGGTADVLTATGLFTNNGTVGVGAGETLNANGGYLQSNLANSSTEIDAGGKLSTGSNAYTQNSNPGSTTATTVNGTLIALGGVNINEGGIQGTGVIQGNVTETDAIITPGSLTSNTPGTLTIDGNFTMVGGTFDELISGTTSGMLDVTGSVDLSGTSPEMLLITAVTPGVLFDGETFTVIDPTSFTGEFANAPNGTPFDMDGWIWTLDYDSTGVELIADSQMPPTSAPEPGEGIMLGAGLLALMIFSRKRLASVTR
jgi:hypothetical protein